VPQGAESVSINEGILRYTISTSIPVDETSEVRIEARISHGLGVLSQLNEATDIHRVQVEAN